MSELPEPERHTPAEPPAAGTPSAQPRIGDADRDQAVGYLQEHLAQGRLDAAEFDERMSQALAAKTASDLDPLFTDLPDPRPATGTLATYASPPWQAAKTVAPKPAAASAATEVARQESSTNPALALITALSWPAVVLLITFLGWGDYWWLIFVPMVISSVLGKDTNDRRARERARIERDQRRLDQRRRAIGE